MASICFQILQFIKAGFWSLLADFLRGKINGDTDRTVYEKIVEIKNNDLHEINKSVEECINKIENLWKVNY